MENCTWMDRWAAMKKEAGGAYWADRVLAELGYLAELSRTQGGKYDDLLKAAVEKLAAAREEDGAITKAAALAAEADLSALSPLVKAVTVYCIGHAHIDMNWEWGFNETASLTVDTFRTMLQLMKEFPGYTFAQSQASTYRIIEEYAPFLLDEIKARVKDGSWEVTASTWVENDKNMSSGEAMARHILSTKSYLSGLLDIPEESLCIDFEPDTFGHSENVPEVLNAGGVRYYYHCRGFEDEVVYRWEAPSGARVLVYREPEWYNADIEPYMLLNLPGLLARYNLSVGLKVYGVGDHGGGPTRRDLKRLQDMMTWPLMPTLTFGTFRQFFDALALQAESLPVVKQELNFVFTGCYTTQSRIKQANRVGEARLVDADTLNVLAKGALPAFAPANDAEASWRRVLFNQFHDILPGSGVPETRDYALGEFQKVMGAAQISATHAMTEMAAAMDTSGAGEAADTPMAAGAGVGFGLEESRGFGFPAAERGLGLTRVYTLFNTTAHDREELAEITLWDWDDDPQLLTVEDADGNTLPRTITAEGTHYWGHQYRKVLFPAKVPAFGWAAYTVKRAPYTALPREFRLDPRIHTFGDEDIVLENSKLRAVFNAETLALTSLTDKESGRQLLDAARPAGTFRFIQENPTLGMSAWVVGPYASDVCLNGTHETKVIAKDMGELRQSFTYTVAFSKSTLEVTVSLDKDASRLNFAVKADWHEIGTPQTTVPQLAFDLPLGYAARGYRYAVPNGFTDRAEAAQDRPGLGLVCALGEQGPTVCLASDCKYGFRGWQNGLSCTLLRSSYEPDLYPETGVHYINLAVDVGCACTDRLTRVNDEVLRPLYAAPTGIHTGTLPTVQRMISVPEGLLVSTVKPGRDGGTVVRLVNPTDKAISGKVTFAFPVKKAARVTLTETPTEKLSVRKGTVSVTVEAGAIFTLKAE